MDEYYSERIRVIDLSQMSLFEVVEQLRTKPLMWLPERTIVCLDAFLTGWAAGKSDWELLSSFSNFVGDNYGIDGSSGWAKILIEYEQDAALDRAMQLFAEYESSVLARDA